MANILDYFGASDLDTLQELSDDLEEILLEIAFNDKTNFEFIKKNQEFMKKEYDEIIERYRDPGGSGIYKAIGCIIDAYDGLQGILYSVNKEEIKEYKKDIEQEAEELLYENLIFPLEYF